MRGKHRSGLATTRLSGLKTSVEDEIAHLRDLDLSGLRARWQSVLQRSPPLHLPRHLLFAVLAYRIQADRFGDLDCPSSDDLRRFERFRNEGSGSSG